MLRTSSLPDKIRLRMKKKLLTCNLDGREADLEIDVLDELENEPYKRCGIRQKDQFPVTCGQDLVQFSLDCFNYGGSLLPLIVFVGEHLDLLILQK